MSFFEQAAGRIPELIRFQRHISGENSPGLPMLITGLSHIHKAHFLSALSGGTSSCAGENFPILVLAETESEALRLSDDINTLAGREVSALYPAKDLHLGAVVAVSREYEQGRINVLGRALRGELPLITATPEAAAQLTLPRSVLVGGTIRLGAGGETTLDLAQFAARLVSLGYTRCDMIEGRGQFSIRGSIADVFPVNMTVPLRIELWDDELDTISVFDLESQRRIDTMKHAEIAPALEILFPDKTELIEKLEAFSKKVRGKAADKVKAMIAADIDRIKSDIGANLDKYLPLCYDEEATLFSYVGSVIVSENVSCTESFRAASAQHTEDLTLLFEEGGLCRGLDRFMLTRSELKAVLAEKAAAYLDTFMRGGDLALSEIVSVNAVQLSSWSGEHKLLVEELTAYLGRGYTAAVFGGTEKAAKTLAQDLRDDGLPADYSESPKRVGKLFAKRVYVFPGTVSGGLEYAEGKLAMLSLPTGRTAETSQKKKKRGRGANEKEIKSLADIGTGDYVVHASYGIGIFEGVTKLTSDKISKDYIKLKYAGTDVLYVPVTQLDLISRYIGNTDSASLRLSKLHSDQWQKAKTKAKAAASELAAELIELYAKRMKSVGISFSPDGEEQKDFENHFAYIETEDQLRCIGEIKRDMEQPRPMDRLLCGDVGFGKTEVALRGAFKCIMDGRQCALLCPTTVLAWQHYQTAIKRMDGAAPVNIELLSRFRTNKEVKIVLEKLEKGVVDLVIGTHRLVQGDVKFHNLGLVIIDEEQRFGVTHKDKFKESFAGVDILTLSATPIPRTLNMAMSGIRDMSVIETPPQDRQPVTTYVIEHDWGIIAQALHKEMRRGGQVYYVHNRIETIMQCAAKVKELCPEASIGIAHGKMGEDELLEVWRKLLDHEIDVLVCTTLIETGIDVPNVNTLFIENADYMGLAQLHQLRGRVGRTNKRAFAYFTFRRGKVLTEIATKRLSAIREFTQFGSGFRIAMRDLEIRGAGSILGQKQSGHLSAVGYDMYLQLLSEAVAEQRGEAVIPKTECLVDIKLDAYIPESYIGNQAQRISCYKRIAEIRSEDDAYDVTDELIDRYGELPRSVEGLIEVAQIRNMAQAYMITEIVQDGGVISVYTDKPDMERTAAAVGAMGGRVALKLTGRTGLRVTLGKNETPLEGIRKFMEAYATNN